MLPGFAYSFLGNLLWAVPILGAQNLLNVPHRARTLVVAPVVPDNAGAGAGNQGNQGMRNAIPAKKSPSWFHNPFKRRNINN
jgi:hypothetical protein